MNEYALQYHSMTLLIKASLDGQFDFTKINLIQPMPVIWN